MSYKTMSEDKFRFTMETLSREAAKKHYLRENPASSDEEAMRFAGRHWRQFVHVAADIIALWEVIDEAEAAPGN